MTGLTTWLHVNRGPGGPSRWICSTVVRSPARSSSTRGPGQFPSLGRFPLARAWCSLRPSSSAHGRFANTRASPPCGAPCVVRSAAARAREARPISRMAAVVAGSSESDELDSSTSGGGPSESEEGPPSVPPPLAPGGAAVPRPRPTGARSCDRLPAGPPLVMLGRVKSAGCPAPASGAGAGPPLEVEENPVTAWVTRASSPGGKESPLRMPWLAPTKGAGVGWSWYPCDPWCGGVAVALVWDVVAPRAAMRRFRSSGRPGRSSSSGDAPFCLGWSAPFAWRSAPAGCDSGWGSRRA